MSWRYLINVRHKEKIMDIHQTVFRSCERTRLNFNKNNSYPSVCSLRNMRINVLTALIFIVTMNILLSMCGAEHLDEYILDYQTLSFDTHHIHSQHERVRRSADDTLHLDFRAYNRNFKLRLKRESDIFDPDHKTVGDDGKLTDVDTSFIYSGHDAGVPRSFAHIAIIGGTARGYVQIPGDTTYHIESAQQYFKNPNFHAVIYPESRMNKDPFRHKREADDFGSCGIDRVRAWMDRVARSSIEHVAKRSTRDRRSAEAINHHERESHYSRYYEESNTGNLNTEHHRKRRATLGTNNTCFLFLSSDPMMWNYVRNEKFKTDMTDERAKEEILAFFASHVSALKNIFSSTIFKTYNHDLSYSGVNFVVQRTRIMTPANQQCSSAAATNYCNPNIDVSNFLNLNSMEQHDEFCLAYIFTHRDFTRGTLGLAWVGAREAASGGICERHKSYLEGDEKVPKSLNTGIVTTVNYGKAVPQRVSQLTFTHEVGHNFGSPHDQGSKCAPYGSEQSNAEDGNYIMFASATMGDRPNNDKFSNCSKDNITRLLHVVVNSLHGKHNCLKPSKTAFCGNGIKEKGEECDCGYSRDCEDRCCFGRESEDGRQCTLRPFKECSPTAGPCCNPRSCKFVENVKCQPADDCRQSSYCQGKSAECPSPNLKPNGTSCNDDAQMCYNGDCVKSVCERIGWKECFLTAGEGEGGPSSEALCYVSCEHPNTSQCVSSYDLKAVNEEPNKAFRNLLLNVTRKRVGKASVDAPDGIQLPAGSPCDNFRGYCDVFHKCRGVDADGPLARLKNLIFNPETLENIQQWIVSHWWAVLLMAIALIIVMGAFIKVCAVHTPSSNPRKPKHRQLTLPRTLQRRQHRRQNRGAGPRSIDPPGNSGGGGSGGGGGGGGGGNSSNNGASSSGASSGGGNGGGRRGGSKPTSSTVLIEHDPPPPYSSLMDDNLQMEILPAPSTATSPSAPMIESAGAPDLSAIPPGGPKRGHGGARKKQMTGQAGGKNDKNKKGKGKGGMEAKMV